MNGAPKPTLSQMPRVDQRLTFLYLDQCKIQCEDSAVKVIDESGIYLIPSAMLSVLLLGPGTDITHRALMLIGDSGMSTVWVGEKGIRFYACGSPLTRSSIFAEKQAVLFSNQRSHLRVAKKMYSKRFGDSVDNMNIQQLRGIEGSRMKKEYRRWADHFQVPWKGRIQDFEQGDLVNQLLSVGTSCLYGLAYSVIMALGMSPALGFIHNSHSKSFVLDLADIYKTTTTIPLAFEIASVNPPEAVSEMRRACRDKFREMKILEKMVADIQDLLELSPTLDDDEFQDVVTWWEKSDLEAFKTPKGFAA
ncbi:type I-E CRISPR-associated endonuclease Cas1 [Erysipelotrichaceae bacterium RD49]|nr:type I-E CRISPR-associated endonuclease Cas1 [Erysipelotrichaceae bacterium RD49]